MPGGGKVFNAMMTVTSLYTAVQPMVIVITDSKKEGQRVEMEMVGGDNSCLIK